MNLLRSSLAAFVIVLSGCSDPPAPAPADAAPVDVVDAAPADATADDVPATPATFAEVQALFTRSCAMPACHGRADGGGGSGGLYLTDGVTSHEAMVGRPSDQVASVRLVVPGDPDNSYLVMKVEGTMRERLPQQCAISPGRNPCGAQMPQLAAPLTADERALIRSWIAAGATMD
jgi:hypothetical protein